VLDGVRREGRRPLDAGLLQGGVEQPSGRPDERLAHDVLAVAGLLADQHDGGVGSAVAHDDLGGVAVEVAPPAGGCRGPERVQVRLGRNPRRRTGELGLDRGPLRRHPSASCR
jgi:hypothetical protein